MCAVVAGKCKLFKFFKGLFMNMYLRFCDHLVPCSGNVWQVNVWQITKL